MGWDDVFDQLNDSETEEINVSDLDEADIEGLFEHFPEIELQGIVEDLLNATEDIRNTKETISKVLKILSEVPGVIVKLGKYIL